MSMILARIRRTTNGWVWEVVQTGAGPGHTVIRKSEVWGGSPDTAREIAVTQAEAAMDEVTHNPECRWEIIATAEVGSCPHPAGASS